jgi:hypothetical protein
MLMMRPCCIVSTDLTVASLESWKERKDYGAEIVLGKHWLRTL